MRLEYLIDDLRTSWRAHAHPEMPPLPPRRMIDFIGGGDFVRLGQEFAAILREKGGLHAGTEILDVGCGCGRIAVPLLGQLSYGAYRGFDVSPRLIAWCQENITRRDQRFEFQTVDVANRYYNPEGKIAPAEMSFPYPDASFDLVCAISVFTHLLPSAARRYLAEAARVLKPGGKFLATFFILNEATTVSLRQKRAGIRFRYPADFYAIEDESRPELAVAYREDYLLGQVGRCGLALKQPIRFGSWRESEKDALNSGYQDILVGTRSFGL